MRTNLILGRSLTSLALGAAFFTAAPTATQASPDYGPARWYPVCSGKWYTSGYGHKFFVIHDMEGYYASCLSYLARCDIQASVHYCANGKKDTTSDYVAGEIAQQVYDAYYAWHATCWNQHSMGTEHEGFSANPAWYTDAMYVSSAALTKSKCEKYGFAKDRNHVVAHGQKLVSGWSSWASANLGINPNCNTHTDPGPYWNWTYFMSLINGGSAVDGAQLVSKTVADDTVVAPGQGFTCAFSMKNSGTTTWTANGGDGYTLNNNGGTTMANTFANPIPASVGPGGSVSIGVPMTAPTTPGTYTANFQMNSTANVYFGPSVYCRIIVRTDPPSLTGQPWSQTRNPGEAVTFTVTASGASLSYQWKKNGANISGATGSSLTLNSVQLADAAFYTVTVSNPGGSVTSQQAQLVVTSGAFAVGTGTGLNGKYYNNIDLTDLRIDRTDATVDFDWGTGSPDANLMWYDTYSIRWSGYVQPRYTQTYTFYTKSDDGARLWVNGQLLIDKWQDQGATEWSGSISLTAGQRYTLQMDYYEQSSAASAQLLWSSASQVKQVIPQTQLSVQTPPVITTQPSAQTKNPGETATFTVAVDGTAPFSYQWKKNGVNISGATAATLTLANVQLANAGFYAVEVNNAVGSAASATVQLAVAATPSAAGTGSGLSASYYGASDFTDLRLVRVDATINFDWSTGAPDASLPADSFSVRWAGQIEPRYTQTYTFYTLTDDGVRLWVNGQLLIDQWVNQAATEYSATIALTAGQKVDVQIDYYDYTSLASAKLSWSCASLMKEVVPATQLYRLAPVLAPIGAKKVMASQTLAFTATASNPNHQAATNLFATWEGNNHGDMQVVFNKPGNSSTTSGFLDTAQTNYSMVVTNAPAGAGGAKALKAQWTFKTGETNFWIRFNTYNAAGLPNPTIGLDQVCTFRLYTTKALKVGVGCRETATTAAYGANGGATGTIDWSGVSGVVSGRPIASASVPANAWTTVRLNIPFEGQGAFTGDGKVDQSGARGVLEHLILRGDGGAGSYTVYIDDLGVIDQNTLAFTLDAGAPSGAALERRTGKFSWTPTPSQVGTHNLTVRVADRLAAQDYETFSVTVESAGNTPPVLAAIGNKSANELAALAFTATATDVDVGQTLTFSLDAGAPAGASINASTGAFAWTPTEAQGPGSYPVTVRVTDNGAPATNDFETITVTVAEVNANPALAVLNDQSVNEGQTLAVTASATDADLPANTLEYNIAGPAGMTINTATGAISWTPTEDQGPATYANVIVTVLDGQGGSASRTFTVTVNEVNTAPVLAVDTTAVTVETVTDLESFEDGSYNGTVLFRQPSFSSTTSAFLDAAVTNVTTATSAFPAGSGLGARALQASFCFKTGTTNPWVRLTTTSAASLPNPIIKLDQWVKFRLYTDKAIKVALGVRETGSAGNVGENGGTTGTLEWAGASGVTGTTPIPTRTIAAGSWQTVEFNLATEPVAPFTGNGILASATMKGVLEHLALVPAAGPGTYNLWIDNLQVVTVTTNLVVDTGATLTFTNITATDADIPGQTLNFSLDAGAPAGAAIDAMTGVFTWKPASAQGPSTNLITVRVTDSGPGNLSDAKTITVRVNKVNLPPSITSVPNTALELNGGSSINLTIAAQDEDVPAQTLTFSLQGTPPAGAAINASTGVFTWTPPNVLSTNLITVRVTDNGVPPLFDEKDMTIIVTPTNTAPVLTLPVGLVTEMVADYESIVNFTNEAVMFKKPGNSVTTSNHVNTSQTQFSYVTNSGVPAGNTNGGSKAMKVQWTFKTGTTNPWIRLTTYNTTLLRNPAFDLTGKIRFSIYSTRSLKVALGLRETGTAATVGADGGATGTIEWVGATNKTANGCPLPTRTVTASNWTTLEFDLPAEPCTAFTGNGVLTNAGKGALECLALVANGGTGAYTVYVDAFRQIYKRPLTNTVAMNTGSTLSFQAAASDLDTPAQVLNFGLTQDSPSGAAVDMSTGAFTWTPTVAGTYAVTVVVDDNPTNGATPKSAAKSFNVTVSADPLGPQSVDGAIVGSVLEGEKVLLTWGSIPGQAYRIQFRDGVEDEWLDVMEVTAVDASTTVEVGGQGSYRVVAAEAQANDQ